MDGRCQDAVKDYFVRVHGVRWVDTITEPGLDGILSGKRILLEQPEHLLPWLRRKAEISAKGHGSEHAVVVGHVLCAGNNVPDAEHIRDIQAAVETVRSWALFKTVFGLIAFHENGEWHVAALDEYVISACETVRVA